MRHRKKRRAPRPKSLMNRAPAAPNKEEEIRITAGRDTPGRADSNLINIAILYLDCN
jgi:hypothetical protein